MGLLARPMTWPVTAGAGDTRRRCRKPQYRTHPRLIPSRDFPRGLVRSSASAAGLGLPSFDGDRLTAIVDEGVDGLLGRQFLRVDDQFRMLGLLIRRRYTGKILDLPGAGTPV